jgi:hypothetical protein
MQSMRRTTWVYGAATLVPVLLLLLLVTFYLLLVWLMPITLDIAVITGRRQ